ncbi:MAG TPA: transcription antitermination factor NusB [Burkholderiales bacterium]|nr:transcription antitermination factor NusB [Burkholderiales bacterium]
MSKSARRRAREYALQGLYQWYVAGNEANDIQKSLAEDPPFAKIDQEFFAALFRGAIKNAPELEASIGGALDRPYAELSPIEKSILLLATYELAHMPEIPYRVVMNEAIELAKSFGGTDGHKYVNGVLDKIGPGLRPGEKAAGA